MAGQHGKNAELRVSTGETRYDDVAFIAHPDSTLAAAGVFVPTSGEKNWKYASPGEDDEATISYIAGASPTVKGIDGNSRYIHYAGGAVLIPPEDFPTLASGSVSGSYTVLEMETVGNLRGDDRSWELNLEADIVDTTVLRENFKTFVEGIPGWSGSIDGLYNNPRTYKLAVANASGVIPRKIMRFKPRPDKNTYWQGTVIFPTHNMSGGYDGAIEKTIDFQGSGPIDLIEDGLPWFPDVQGYDS